MKVVRWVVEVLYGFKELYKFYRVWNVRLSNFDIIWWNIGCYLRVLSKMCVLEDYFGSGVYLKKFL